MKTTFDFFIEKVKITPNCWEWKASKNSKGYGTFSYGGKTNCAHRFSYQIYKGSIRRGKAIDHLCANKLCVSPHHLEMVSYRENMLRRYRFKAHMSSAPN